MKYQKISNIYLCILLLTIFTGCQFDSEKSPSKLELLIPSSVYYETNQSKTEIPQKTLTSTTKTMFPFEQIPSEHLISWHGISPGTTKEQALVKIGKILGANFYVAKRDKINQPGYMTDAYEHYSYVDEFFYVTENDKSFTRISVRKEKVVLLNINTAQFDIENCFLFFGLPEKYTAFYNEEIGRIDYVFLYPSLGVAFGGNLPPHPGQKKHILPDFPVTSINLISPNEFHVLYEDYYPIFMDVEKQQKLLEEWRGYNSVKWH